MKTAVLDSSDTLLYAYCKAMWVNPNRKDIEDVLKGYFKVQKLLVNIYFIYALLQVHQAKYGKRMVPDSQLSKLLSQVCKLPEVFEESEDLDFVQNVHSKGLHIATNILTRHEALIVALLSLYARNFYQVSFST